MTDEERKKLVEGLCHLAVYNNPICEAAANEIKRLAEENDRFRRALNNAWRTIEEDTDHD